MKKDEAVFLRHMLDAIESIEEYTRGVSFERFMADPEKQDAVVRRLEIVGEAARNVPSEFQERHDEMPWADVIALRNRIVHAYFAINLSIVWDVVQHDLPRLKDQLETLLGSGS